MKRMPCSMTYSPSCPPSTTSTTITTITTEAKIWSPSQVRSQRGSRNQMPAEAMRIPPQQKRSLSSRPATSEGNPAAAAAAATQIRQPHQKLAAGAMLLRWPHLHILGVDMLLRKRCRKQGSAQQNAQFVRQSRRHPRGKPQLQRLLRPRQLQLLKLLKLKQLRRPRRLLLWQSRPRQRTLRRIPRQCPVGVRRQRQHHLPHQAEQRPAPPSKHHLEFQPLQQPRRRLHLGPLQPVEQHKGASLLTCQQPAHQTGIRRQRAAAGALLTRRPCLWNLRGM
jgi:hypothetical protein